MNKKKAIKYNQVLQKKHKSIKYVEGVENSQSDCSHVINYDLGNEIPYETIEGDKNMEENNNVLSDDMIENLKEWSEPMTTDKNVEHEEIHWVNCTRKDYINSLVSDWNKFSDEQKEEVCKYLGGEREKITVKNLLEKFKEIKEDEKSKIHLSARIDSVVLRCSNCGANLTNLVPEKYKAHATFSGTHVVNEKNKIQEKFVFDNNVCPNCGSNVFDADIGIAIDKK